MPLLPAVLAISQLYWPATCHFHGAPLAPPACHAIVAAGDRHSTAYASYEAPCH